LIRVGLRRRAGIPGLLQILDQANKALYKPRDYNEEEMLRGILFLRLRGSHLAHRTLGSPGISRLHRNASISSLNPSVGIPTKTEVRRNIRAVQTNDCYGYVLMIDEITIEQRLRWDPGSNNVLGLCPEHWERWPRILFFRPAGSGDVFFITDARNSPRVPPKTASKNKA